MNARLENAGHVPDAVKWLSVAALVAGATGAFYYYSDQSLLLRVIGLLVVIAIAAFIAAQTQKGNVAWGFIRESRTEVRKVVWPTRAETTQTTLIVIAMVALVAVLMWILDGVLAWLVRVILGQGG